MSFPQISEAKQGWLSKIWLSWHMQPKGLAPIGFYQTFQQMNFNLVLDQMLLVHCQLEGKMATKLTSSLYTIRAGVSTL